MLGLVLIFFMAQAGEGLAQGKKKIENKVPPRVHVKEMQRKESSVKQRDQKRENNSKKNNELENEKKDQRKKKESTEKSQSSLGLDFNKNSPFASIAGIIGIAGVSFLAMLSSAKKPMYNSVSDNYDQALRIKNDYPIELRVFSFCKSEICKYCDASALDNPHFEKEITDMLGAQDGKDWITARFLSSILEKEGELYYEKMDKKLYYEDSLRDKELCYDEDYYKDFLRDKELCYDEKHIKEEDIKKLKETIVAEKISSALRLKNRSLKFMLEEMKMDNIHKMSNILLDENSCTNLFWEKGSVYPHDICHVNESAWKKELISSLGFPKAEAAKLCHEISKNYNALVHDRCCYIGFQAPEKSMCPVVDFQAPERNMCPVVDEAAIDFCKSSAPHTSCDAEMMPL